MEKYPTLNLNSLPPIAQDAVVVGTRFAFGRFIIWPLFAVFTVLAMVVYSWWTGKDSTPVGALLLVGLFVFCVLWIVYAIISSFARAFGKSNLDKLKEEMTQRYGTDGLNWYMDGMSRNHEAVEEWADELQSNPAAFWRTMNTKFSKS